MSLYPAAEQRIWKPYDPERFIQPRAVIVHTNAVNAEDPGPTGGLSWHFQVGEHGHVYQHRDTGTRGAANANANDFAISIETWDGGDPEGNPWNPEQLDALVALIGWCCDNHAIPRRKIATWDGYGIGYHRLFTEWDIPYHSCPGNTRAAQFDAVILPRLQAPPVPVPPPSEEDDMAYFIAQPEGGNETGDYLVDTSSGLVLALTSGAYVDTLKLTGAKGPIPMPVDLWNGLKAQLDSVRTGK